MAGRGKREDQTAIYIIRYVLMIPLYQAGNDLYLTVALDLYKAVLVAMKRLIR